MSQTPKFLLNGINATQNFLGTKLARSAAYGVFETSLRILTVPVLIGVGTAASTNGTYTFDETLVEGEVNPEVRRTSLQL